MNRSQFPIEHIHDGQLISIALCKEDPRDEEDLRAFYDEFTPKGVAQGLPPHAKEIRDRWISGLFRNGVNVVAHLNGKAIGHAAFVGFRPRECEYLVFVFRDHQGKGIGSVLTRACVCLAGEQGFERIWLSVEPDNRRAISVYSKAGFKYVGSAYDEMELILLPEKNAFVFASEPISLWSAVIPLLAVYQTMQYTQIHHALTLLRTSRQIQDGLACRFRRSFFSMIFPPFSLKRRPRSGTE